MDTFFFFRQSSLHTVRHKLQWAFKNVSWEVDKSLIWKKNSLCRDKRNQISSVFFQTATYTYFIQYKKSILSDLIILLRPDRKKGVEFTVFSSAVDRNVTIFKIKMYKMPGQWTKVFSMKEISNKLQKKKSNINPKCRLSVRTQTLQKKNRHHDCVVCSYIHIYITCLPYIPF